MDLLGPEQVQGDMVRMKRTDPRHLDASGNIPQDRGDPGSGFSYAFTQALNGVNDLQNRGTDLAEQMIINPDSVDPHDVTIAMAKANTSLQMTKTILDTALKAYREIISIR